MQIQWQGHACFRIRGSGVCVVTDPYTPEVAGLSPLREPPLLAISNAFRISGLPGTIELDDLDTALRAVQPKIVIPMHYKIPNLKLNILGLEAFTGRYPAERVEVRSTSEIDLTPETLPPSMRIVALQPAANA